MNVLVLMPCSATKLDHRAEAWQLYQGPMWQTLRTWLPESVPLSNVVVLSGKHGWVRSTQQLDPYEERLTPAKADALIEQGLDRHTAKLFDRGPYSVVISAGAGEYRRVFEATIAQLHELGLVTPIPVIGQVQGGIGEQRGQLGAMLRAIGATVAA